jgi:hypothetical protein
MQHAPSGKRSCTASASAAVCTASGEPPGIQTEAYFTATFGPRSGRMMKCSSGHHSQRLSCTTRWSWRNSAR